MAIQLDPKSASTAASKSASSPAMPKASTEARALLNSFGPDYVVSISQNGGNTALRSIRQRILLAREATAALGKENGHTRNKHAAEDARTLLLECAKELKELKEKNQDVSVSIELELVESEIGLELVILSTKCTSLGITQETSANDSIDDEVKNSGILSLLSSAGELSGSLADIQALLLQAIIDKSRENNKAALEDADRKRSEAKEIEEEEQKKLEALKLELKAVNRMIQELESIVTSLISHPENIDAAVALMAQIKSKITSITSKMPASNKEAGLMIDQSLSKAQKLAKKIDNSSTTNPINAMI